MSRSAMSRSWRLFGLRSVSSILSAPPDLASRSVITKLYRRRRQQEFLLVHQARSRCSPEGPGRILKTSLPAACNYRLEPLAELSRVLDAQGYGVVASGLV